MNEAVTVESNSSSSNSPPPITESGHPNQLFSAVGLATLITLVSGILAYGGSVILGCFGWLWVGAWLLCFFGILRFMPQTGKSRLWAYTLLAQSILMVGTSFIYSWTASSAAGEIEEKFRLAHPELPSVTLTHTRFGRPSNGPEITLFGDLFGGTNLWNLHGRGTYADVLVELTDGKRRLRHGLLWSPRLHEFVAWPRWDSCDSRGCPCRGVQP